MTAPPVLNALSIDLEDWFHIIGEPGLEATAAWDAHPSIVEAETEIMLETLRDHGVTATFFVLGWIAAKYPALIARIAAQGHEIACHSHWHRPVFSLSREAFRDDMRTALDAIGSAAGAQALGFRAPSFSITPGTEWAFDELLALGFVYDASLFPVRRRHGGYPCPRGPHAVDTPEGGRIAELPMSVMRMGGAEFAFSGGGYFRLLPLGVIRRGVAQLNAAGLPAVVYLHPRDFTPDWPWRDLPFKRRLLGRVGIEGARGKFNALLREFRFGSCASVLAERKLIDPAQ